MSTTPVVYTSSQLRPILEKHVARLGFTDGVFIDAIMPADGQPAHQYRGLDKALELAPTGVPIVIFSVVGYDASMIRDERYHAALGYPNVAYVDAITEFDRWGEALGGAKARIRPADPLAIRLLALKEEASQLGILAHDLGHAERGDRLEAWLVRARAAGLVGSDDEIIAHVRTSREPQPTPLAGESFPGIFVDLEGTLLVEGSVRADLVDWLKLEAATRPITLWTGGDAADYRRELSRTLPWKVVSKTLFRGATVEVAVDNEPETKQGAAYGYRAARYFQLEAGELPGNI